MVAGKETLFTQKDPNGRNGEGARVWKPVNNQQGTCIIGAAVSPIQDPHNDPNDLLFKNKGQI